MLTSNLCNKHDIFSNEEGDVPFPEMMHVYYLFQTGCQNVTRFCYCPSLSVCEQRQYSIIDMGSKVTATGQHNRRYHFSVFVRNNANLSTTQHIDILVDSSPPMNGSVKEGPKYGRDVDYTSENRTIIHWEGFIDHESGIKFYKVAISRTCLNTDEMTSDVNGYVLNDTRILTTEHSNVAMTFPGEGKYFTTVVAFNNAMEPSYASCSDGITYDTTPLDIVDFRGRNFVIEDSIACTGNKTWLIKEDLTRVALKNSPVCDDMCSRFSFPDFISSLPIERRKASDSAYSDGICAILKPFGKNPILTSSDTLDLQWNFSDEYSQLNDFQIGFGRNPTEINSPSFEGKGYKSTSGNYNVV